MRRDTPPARGLFGISTRKRPARLMKVVSAAPLLPRSSFSTWTMISWPSSIRSRMPRLPFLAGLLVLEERLGDFLQRQEAVAVGAVVDERSLEAGFDAGDAALVDVGFLGFARRDFDVQVVDPLAVDQGYAQLFVLSCVDEHSLHRPSRYWRLGPRTVRTGSGAVAWGRGLAATARALICCSSGAPAQCARCVTESWCCRASYPPGSRLARCPPGLRHLRVFTADRWSEILRTN